MSTEPLSVGTVTFVPSAASHGGHRQLELEIVVPDHGEEGVRHHVHAQVEVTRGGVPGPGLALAGQADHRALPDADGNMHVDRFRPPDHPRSPAGRAEMPIPGASAVAVRGTPRTS